MRLHPPIWIIQFFRWYCHPKLVHHIEGDLHELYQQRLSRKGKRAADWMCFMDVLLLLRPGIIRPMTTSPKINNTAMLKNYMIISWRTLMKNKAFSAINIAGLAVGLASCLLILQFVVYELSFDHFNSKLDRTYRVINDRYQNGGLIQHGTITYPTIGPTMARDFPEIESFVRMMPVGEVNIRVGDKNFRNDQAVLTDSRMFDVFDFKLLAGEKTHVLDAPYKVILTERTARKYFSYSGTDLRELTGKTFLWGHDKLPYEVAGIMENIPANSHIQFDAFISYATIVSQDKDAESSWTWSDMYHYLVLREGADPKQLESKFDAFSDRYFNGDKVTGSKERFYLQPLKAAHLYSDYEYDFAVTASGRAVWSLLTVAVFILVIAWINYINLTTSRVIDRAKEAGLRKVMGAFRRQLVMQFIMESVMMTTGAALLAFVIVWILQSPFNQIVGSELSWRLLFTHVTPTQFFAAFALLITGAIVSGYYPALMLSGFQPAMVLKGKFVRSSQGNFLRKALVVFQFSASTALICGTLIVTRQIKFMNSTDLGVKLNDVLAVEAPELMEWDSTFIQRVEDFKHELTGISGVQSATTSWRLPGDRLGRAFNIRISGQPAAQHYTVSHMGVDFDFFKTMGIHLIAGRDFLPTDHDPDFAKLSSIIINRNASVLFGFSSPQDAIGREVLWGDNGARKWTIIGVVNDYHQEALQKPMEPIVFRPVYATNSPISVRFNTGNRTELLGRVEQTYRKFFPGNSFEYTFLDDYYNRQYNDVTRFGKVIVIFTVLAIAVACLGLIGLSSYTAVMRTKEIGVRKVMGASALNIVTLLSINFVGLVVLAAVISIPLSYLGTREWLEGFSYRITPEWFIFLMPVLMVILIAALTISSQVLRAAMTKPADTLRYE
ncbi:MAG: ABC transporter permease [Bacteroidetes bacterium]|nr:ABC transporter permease [Bacteroidota bacterium]